MRQIFYLALSLCAFFYLWVGQASAQIKVGVSMPLTGVAVDWGLAYKKGIELALQDHAADAEKLELVYDDNQYDNKTSVSSARKLVNVDKVNLLLVWGFNPSDVIAPLSKELSVPLLLSSINPVGKGRDNVINLSDPLRSLMSPLVDALVAKQVKNVSFLSTPIGALEQSVAILKELLPENIEVRSTYSVPTDTQDFRTLITKLKKDSPAALFSLLLPIQNKAFVEQAQALDYKVPMYGGNTWDDAISLKVLADFKQDVTYVDRYADPQFIERLRGINFPIAHGVEAAHGYFIGELLVKMATELKPPYTPQSLINFIESSANNSGGPAGAYRFSRDADFGTNLVFPKTLKVYQHGKLVR